MCVCGGGGGVYSTFEYSTLLWQINFKQLTIFILKGLNRTISPPPPPSSSVGGCPSALHLADITRTKNLSASLNGTLVKIFNCL